MNREGVSLLAKCLKGIGNAPIAEKKSLSFPLSLRLIDQFIAKIVGQKEELKDLDATKPPEKSRSKAAFLLYNRFRDVPELLKSV